MTQRQLRYVVVEAGQSVHCHKDAGDHGVDGLCDPTSTHQRFAEIAEPVYRGATTYAFVDLKSAEVRAWMRQ